LLRIVHGEKEIHRAQTQFSKSLGKSATNTQIITLGWQGGREAKRVSWNTSLGIFWTIDLGFSGSGYYWNLFGITGTGWNPKLAHSITCEINVHPRGIGRTIAGSFATDDDGRYCLVHRGKIGGGKQGIGKSLFQNQYRGAWTKASNGNYTEDVALIGFLQSKRFPQQVANFVKEVARIKQLVRANRPHSFKKSTLQTLKFSPEFSGRKGAYTPRDRIEPEADHGLIVNALADELKSRGFRVGNRGVIDLYAEKKRKGQVVFEVKTSGDLASCYTATGQLLFNAKRLGGNPKMVGVFPTGIPVHVNGIFRQIGIDLLTFGWSNGKPDFNRKLLALV
jgi:hypothetical protein